MYEREKRQILIIREMKIKMKKSRVAKEEQWMKKKMKATAKPKYKMEGKKTLSTSSNLLTLHSKLAK